MIVFQPEPRILQDIIANAIRPGIIEVQSLPPRGLVFIRKVGTKLTGIIAFRSEMIIDHIDDDRNAFPVRCIDETLEAGDTAIGVLYGEGIDAVIAPVAVTWELRQWHELDRIDAQLHEVIEPLYDPFKVVRGREGAGMQFVDDLVAERDAFPVAVRPGKMPVGDGGGAVYALRLIKGGRVGAGGLAVETVSIERSGADGKTQLP